LAQDGLHGRTDVDATAGSAELPNPSRQALPDLLEALEPGGLLVSAPGPALLGPCLTVLPPALDPDAGRDPLGADDLDPLLEGLHAYEYTSTLPSPTPESASRATCATGLLAESRSARSNRASSVETIIAPSGAFPASSW